MLPITIDIKNLIAIVVGDGYTTDRRVKILQEAGAKNIKIFKQAPDAKEYSNAAIVFVGGFDEEESAKIAQDVRKSGALLNIEDKKQHCDFHMPSIVRRGDLLLAISTSGASPRLAQHLRTFFEDEFGAEWVNNLQVIRMEREKWLEQGLGHDEIIEKSDDLFDELGIFEE